MCCLFYESLDLSAVAHWKTDFRISKLLNCNYKRICVVSRAWSSQYTEKTVYFGTTLKENLWSRKASAVSGHMKNWSVGYCINDFHVNYVWHYNRCIELLVLISACLRAYFGIFVCLAHQCVLLCVYSFIF